MTWTVRKAVHLLVLLLAVSSFHNARVHSQELDIILDELNFERTEDAVDNTITVTKLGENFAEIEVRINLFTVDEFEGIGSIPPGEDISNPAEPMDFDPTPLNVTIPPSDMDMMLFVPLNSIVQDTINEAQQGLVLQLEVVTIQPMDEERLINSTSDVAILLITDDDDIVVGFSITSLTVSEGDGVINEVSFGILDGGTTEQLLEIIVTYNPGSANFVSPSDVSILSPPTTPTLSGTGLIGMLNITTSSIDTSFEVIDDELFEPSEDFSAILSTPAGLIDGLTTSPTPLVVTILDNEGQPEVGFTQSEFRISESVGTFIVPFTFLVPADPSDLSDSIFITLTVSVQDGTALESEQFTFTVIENNIFSTQPMGTIELEIIDDSIVNEDRDLFISLTSEFFIVPFLLTVNETRVIIEDDDAIAILPNPILTVIEGENVFISCTPVDPSDPDFMLLENGVDITQGTPSTDANETRTYDLGIADRQNNGNIYQCVNGAIMSENTTLNVQYPPEYSGQLSFIAFEDNNFNVQLELSGNPFPLDDTLSWTFNGMLLFVGGTVNFGLAFLSFSPINRNNTGTYTVTSSNFIDSANFTFDVEVFFAPDYTVVSMVSAFNGQTNVRVMLGLEANPIPPDGNFTWTSGGVELISGVGGVTLGVDFIEFDVVGQALDGTTYEVEGVNIAGVGTASFQLSVLFAPVYTAMNITVIEGENPFVQLGLEANPIPTVFEWFMDGTPLTSGDTVVLAVDSIDFVADAGIDRSQAGTYEVSSSNDAGNGSGIFMLEVLFPPTYMVADSFTVMGGEMFSIPLGLTGNPLPLDTNFFLNGQQIFEMSGIQLGPNFITIEMATQMNEGEYTVNASNVAGVGNATFQLIVLSTTQVAPVYTAMNITVIEGDTQFVQLGLVADPIPTVFEWFLDGVPLTSGDTVDLAVDSINFVSPINRSQAGTYEVMSSNDAGTGSATFMLDVLFRPTYMVADSFTVMEGEMLSIPLGLTGNPLPLEDDVNFFLDGRQIFEMPGIQLAPDVITIEMVTRMDEGEYMVNASNVAGVGNATFQLIVTTQPITTDPPMTTIPTTDGTLMATPMEDPDSGTGGDGGGGGVPGTGGGGVTDGEGGGGGGIGGDPHFSLILPTGQQLCFSVQGEHDFTFNLVSSPLLSINARFDQDARRPEVTWIGSLGVVVNTKKPVTKIRFESATKTIHIGNRAAISAKNIEKLVVKKGKLQVSENPLGIKDAHAAPEVQVEILDVGISFGVRFMKSHIDMVWQEMKGKQFNNSHGMLGQFFRSGVEVDETRRLLLLPNMEPVPVMRKPVWHFMERDTPDKQLCWVAMNPGYQGKHLIEGHYLDYLVDNVLISKFKFKGGKYKKLMNFLKKK